MGRISGVRSFPACVCLGVFFLSSWTYCSRFTSFFASNFSLTSNLAKVLPLLKITTFTLLMRHPFKCARGVACLDRVHSIYHLFHLSIIVSRVAFSWLTIVLTKLCIVVVILCMLLAMVCTLFSNAMIRLEDALIKSDVRSSMGDFFFGSTAKPKEPCNTFLLVA